MFRSLCAGACSSILLAACALPAVAQQGVSACRGADDDAEDLIAYAQLLAAPTDDDLVQTAAAYSIPPVGANQVALLTDGNLCSRAARSYAQELDERGPVSRRVYLVRIGIARDDIRYLVVDPDHRAGNYEIVMVFDHRFQRLASFSR
jgi:hypothetical protein